MRKIIHICIFALSFSLLFACQSNISNENNENGQTSGLAEQAKDPRDKVNKTGEEIAENLVHLAERVPDVKAATAIVIGDLAVVGVNVNPKLDRSDVGVIKYEVAEALRHDPHGAYAFISADPDINERIRQMNKEIKDGHPVAGILNELAGIVGRLIPVVPGAEHEKSEEEPTKVNEKKLPEGKEQKLKNIQEKQGKRDMEK